MLQVADGGANAQQVIDWKAALWPASGMAAIMQRDPADEAGRRKVLEAPAIAARGAFPDAAFLVSMKVGYYVGSNSSGPLVTDFAGHGGHGFSPANPEMRSALIVADKGVSPGRDVGLVT